MSGPVVFVLRLLLTISLYAFLAWAFITLWRDVKMQGKFLVTHTIPPLSLTILRDEYSPQIRNFVRSEVTIGRSPACECPLEDDTVSGRHARLSFHHNQWWLEDLDSTNGTMLNQEKVTLPTVVISGDEFTCGDTRLTISLPDELQISPTKNNLKRSQ